MSLMSLPPELILNITKYLLYSDEQSLRVTCRACYKVLPPPDKSFPQQLLIFRSRLLRPGNVFSSNNVTLCGQCGRMIPSSSFPFGSDLQVDNNQICDDCLAGLVIGGLRSRYYKYQYKDSFFYCCYHCYRTKATVRFLQHPGEADGGDVKFCSNECHLKHCNDTECDWI